MKSDQYRDSFLNQDWFPCTEELPADAIEQICQHSLDLQQAMASMVEQLHLVTWHEHPLPTIALMPQCQACRMEHDCQLMLRRICADLSGVVMDFYDEPDHHRELEVAVRLYAWSLFLVNLCVDRLHQDYSEALEDYARYRLEELYEESLVYKGLEEAEYERGETRQGKTTDLEKRFLVTTFTTVYTTLLDDLRRWQKVRPSLPLTAFPASSAAMLLRPSVDAPQWLATQEVSAAEKATLITLPLYEWHLLAMLLAESVVHFSYCQSPYGRPMSPPTWMPRHHQQWGERPIVQSCAFWHGLITGLSGLDKHFSVHICEDFHLGQAIPDQAMRQALMQRLYTLNGSPEDYDAESTYQVVGHGSLLWYVARRIETQLAHTANEEAKASSPHLPS